MTALLLSSLFPEADPSELAGVSSELGFSGVDLAVRGLPHDNDERALALLAAEEAPALLLSSDSCEPAELKQWAELAAAAGCRAIRVHPFPDDRAGVADDLAALAAVAAETGVRLLVPNRAGSLFATPETLAAALAEHDPEHLAAMLEPDQVPRSRAGDHVAWLTRMPLPAVGGVCIAGYRWDAQIGTGNIRLWSPQPTFMAQSLTPWPAWLQRLKELSFDGLFTFGDASLPAGVAERVRLSRDDLRFLRRLWSPRPRGTDA